MLQRETVSPERTEIERQAEYFELEVQRWQRLVRLAQVAVYAIALAAITALLGGCDKRPEDMRRAADGTCTLITRSYGEVDRVITGLACPDTGPR